VVTHMSAGTRRQRSTSCRADQPPSARDAAVLL